MAELIAPCGWAPVIIPGTPCSVDPEDPANAAAVLQAQNLASALLWRLTGLKYGACPVVLRPCKPRQCDPITLAQLIYWDSRAYLTFGQPNLGVLSFFPTLIGGQVYNVSSCGSCGIDDGLGGCQKCEADCQYELPAPVASVTTVTVDGVNLLSSQWRVYDDNLLVIDPAVCPTTQNYNLDLGAVGTWSVTYQLGTPVPEELNFAAGLYANEILKSLSGDKSCQLPARVQAVARQGVNVTYVDPLTLAVAGLTGVPLVDQVISALNPYKLREPTRVWAPGMATRNKTQTQP